MPCLSGSHENHDACWCVVSANHQLPVCIACIIEQLEDHSLTMVQQQFNLTVLFGLMADNGEVSSLFHEHPPVCQLLLDIITEHYTDNSHMAVSVDICAHIIDDIQQEELYIYLLNRLEVKFQHDVETTPFILSLLVRLAAASSVYTLTLAHTHGPLLRNLLNIQATSVICDEDVQCSLSLLITHLCDADVLPTVSTDVLPLIELCLLSWLTSAQSPSLQVNCSALLKRVLQSEGCLLEDQETWSPLFHGLKRMFVSKREVLQTCAAQCLAIIATSSRHSHHLQQALKSDLPEFLFESLHTTNGTQLQAVFSCLHLFAAHELFFERCHALYGMEPVLHALGVSLETQNVAVLESGFSLLAFILERQLETVPLFANKNTEQLALCVIKKGLECHLIQVSLAASRAVAAFFRDSGQRDPSPFSVKQLAEIACARLTGPMARGESGHLLHILGIQDEQLMRVLLALLSGVSKSVRADEDLFDLIMNKCDEDVIPYFTERWARCDGSMFLTLFCFLDLLFGSDHSALSKLAEKLLSSGFIMRVLMLKYESRSNSVLTSSASCLLVRVFTVVLREHYPQYPVLPECLHSGLKKLHLRDTLQQTVEDVLEEDSAVALCMVLYFACLEDDIIFPPTHILTAVQVLYTKGVKCSQSNPFIAKFLLFLVAWSASQLKDDIPEDISLQPGDICVKSNVANCWAVEQHIVSHICDLPVEMWATPSPVVFLWLFSNRLRALGPGRNLMEYWLLHTRGKLMGSGIDDTFVTLAHLVDFRRVLMDLMVLPSEEISVWTTDFVLHLLRSATQDEDAGTELRVHLFTEVTASCLDLFLQAVCPARHAVASLLRVLSVLIQQIQHINLEDTSYMKLIFHVVQYFAGVDICEHQMLLYCLAFFQSLFTATNEIQDRKVIPVLLQNPGFMASLQTCLTMQKDIFCLAYSLVAGISSASLDCPCPQPIKINVKCIIETITQAGGEETIVPALRILHQALSPNASTPVLVLHRDGSLLQEEPLFTSRELRQLYCYLQQYLCWKDEETKFHAAQCLTMVIEYSLMFDSRLGEYLVHHPWNKTLVRCLLSPSSCAQFDLPPQTATLISKIWKTETTTDSETAKVILESLVLAEVTDENYEVLLTLLQQTKPVWRDTSLVQKVESRLSNFRNDSCSFSQNLLTPT